MARDQPRGACDQEPSTVQQQILTATVKKFVKSPQAALRCDEQFQKPYDQSCQDSRELVGRVLKLCTDESTNPDLRDRGWMYWRTLVCKQKRQQVIFPDQSSPEKT